MPLQSGTINVPGGKQALGSGGIVLDDNQANGMQNDGCAPWGKKLTASFRL